MNPISVLLVDSHHMFRQIVADFVAQYDELIIVGVTASSEDALIQARNLRPDVLLVGLDLPTWMAIETITQLRAMWPDMAIIALNLLTADVYRQAALAAGADDFVLKANLGAELLPTIQRIMQTDR